MKRKLIAALACRNQGSRLYGKPLQNLDVSNRITILDNIIQCIKAIKIVDEVILGISAGIENEVFKKYAQDHHLRFVIGDEIDVLSRLIKCGELGEATDIFRVTSESPFLYHEPVEACWQKYKENNLDALFMDEIIDGCGFEIISLAALKTSHANGNERHKSELCSLYIRENKELFRIGKELPPFHMIRRDLRLTVDNPEDLAVCRALYMHFKIDAPLFNLSEMINYLDKNTKFKELILPFTEEGYALMNK
jgi:spore coat polysaccharide biosynthesis protein SpsF